MSERVIRLKGEVDGARIDARLLRELLDVLIDGSKQALRLQVEGRSTARGPAPAWIDEAAAFAFTGLREGSTCVVVEPPTLQHAVAEKFTQTTLFADIDASRSGLDYFLDSLHDAAAGKEDSDRFDAPMIKTFARLAKLEKHGVASISFEDGESFEVGKREFETIANLEHSIPPSQRVRLSGILNAIKASDKQFELRQDGGAIRGIIEHASSQELGSMFGTSVVVSGTAHFRPSGSVLRIDADNIEPAGDDAPLWAKPPKASSTSQGTFDLHRTQGPKSGLSAIFGQWPGDESDEEIAAALADS